jgi:hypothetical protein
LVEGKTMRTVRFYGEGENKKDGKNVRHSDRQTRKQRNRQTKRKLVRFKEEETIDKENEER